MYLIWWGFGITMLHVHTYVVNGQCYLPTSPKEINSLTDLGLEAAEVVILFPCECFLLLLFVWLATWSNTSASAGRLFCQFSHRLTYLEISVFGCIGTWSKSSPLIVCGLKFCCSYQKNQNAFSAIFLLRGWMNFFVGWMSLCSEKLVQLARCLRGSLAKIKNENIFSYIRCVLGSAKISNIVYYFQKIKYHVTLKLSYSTKYFNNIE